MRETGTVKGHAHKSRKASSRIKAGVSPVIVPNPTVWATAVFLAGEDARRCFIVPGAVIVANGTRRPKWLS